jgi:4-alpha-glucanotransferase
MKKNLGVLLPVASLPGRHGIGDFGEPSIRFIDWLKENNYLYWQILPLNPLGPGYSPYMSTCSYAYDYRYISLDLLVKEGLLDNVPSFKEDVSEVDYYEVGNYKKEYLYKAYLSYLKTNQKGLKKFKKENPWVNHFATFETFKDLNDQKCWNEWEKWQMTYFESHKLPPRRYKDKIDFIKSHM